MALENDDLALMSARFGVARFGATRFGFIPCPEDVVGTGPYPGEYIYKEVQPPTTDWTLVGGDCVCLDLCTLELTTLVLDDVTPDANQTITVTVTLSGVIGEPSGVSKIAWGDGGHDQAEHSLLENGELEFTHRYDAAGTYTIALTVYDERGCSVTATPLGVTVAAGCSGFSVSHSFIEGECHSAGAEWHSTPSGGSGTYTYAWTVWAENSSEGAPIFTATTQNVVKSLAEMEAILLAEFPLCSGTYRIVVTDSITSCVSNQLGSWAWCCE